MRYTDCVYSFVTFNVLHPHSFMAYLYLKHALKYLMFSSFQPTTPDNGKHQEESLRLMFNKIDEAINEGIDPSRIVGKITGDCKPKGTWVHVNKTGKK